MCRELKYLLQSLKYNNGNARHMILQNIAALIQKATRDELLCLLDVLNTTNDIELKVHMISLCSVYLQSNNEDIEVFITNNYMYVSIESILLKNLPKKTTVLLNFLTLLLHADKEVFAARKLSLGTHVRHMIRISGCLATMAEFFISGNLYQDTWEALCQCLAETCCSCEINQSYCSHLIPKCVQVCRQGNLDAPPLLFNLLHNHQQNIRIFIQTHGMCLFSRNLLQYISYLQLLDTVIQTSPQAAIIANKSDTFSYVREILKSHGLHSQMGQWATIILSRADTIIKEYKQINGSIERNVANDNNKNDLGLDHSLHCDNTPELFQNIIKELIRWQPAVDVVHNNLRVQNKTQVSYKEKDRIRNDRQETFDNHKEFLQGRNEDNETSCNFQPNIKWQESRDDDLAFSFLNEFDPNSTCKEYNNIAAMEITTKKINSSDILNDFNDNNNTGGNMSRDTARQHSLFHVNNNNGDISIASNKYFKPKFMSTPKKKMNKERTRKNIKINISDMVKNQVHTLNKVNFHKRQKSIVYNELKNKSLSCRLFNAINNSCTTIVSKVKNIFTFNNDSSARKCTISRTKSNTKQRDLCNYSFTKFMDERDSRLENGNRSKSNLTCKSITNSCSTCDDTKELKQKLKDNKHLKHTIKKLTLGINLYGCDFKKISKVMWPQETYMTPKVLYNLYRKLIRK